MGIDVYHGDGRVNWPVVKASGHGFGICKATQGTSVTDERFGENMRGLKAASMIRGPYHYFTTAYPFAQAKHFLEILQANGYDFKRDLPPALDVEDKSLTTLSRAQLVSSLSAFLHTVEAVSGRLCLFYVSRSFADDYVGDGFSGHPFWLAEYNSHDQPALPKAWKTWKFWQYNDTATVPGVGAGSVDVDRFNGDLDDLKSWLASL